MLVEVYFTLVKSYDIYKGSKCPARLRTTLSTIAPLKTEVFFNGETEKRSFDSDTAKCDGNP